MHLMDQSSDSNSVQETCGGELEERAGGAGRKEEAIGSGTDTTLTTAKVLYATYVHIENEMRKSPSGDSLRLRRH